MSVATLWPTVREIVLWGGRLAGQRGGECRILLELTDLDWSRLIVSTQSGQDRGATPLVHVM
jgi:hypothetical protein